MRRVARVDTNQKSIVAALRRAGASVLHLHQLGRGCPDLAVGYRGRTILIEIKDGIKPRSKRQLTPDESKFHQTWRGAIAIVESEEQALALLTGL